MAAVALATNLKEIIDVNFIGLWFLYCAMAHDWDVEMVLSSALQLGRESINLPGGHDSVARIIFPIHLCQQRFQGSSLPGYEAVVKHEYIYIYIDRW